MIAGTAALTSATIYRFKVESLFLFERLQWERPMIDATQPPQIVVMPFRFEIYSTTVEELFDSRQDSGRYSHRRARGEHDLRSSSRGGAPAQPRGVSDYDTL
jgi:hypothetical protein